MRELLACMLAQFDALRHKKGSSCYSNNFLVSHPGLSHERVRSRHVTFYDRRNNLAQCRSRVADTLTIFKRIILPVTSSSSQIYLRFANIKKNIMIEKESSLCCPDFIKSGKFNERR